MFTLEFDVHSTDIRVRLFAMLAECSKKKLKRRADVSFILFTGHCYTLRMKRYIQYNMKTEFCIVYMTCPNSQFQNFQTIPETVKLSLKRRRTSLFGR